MTTTTAVFRRRRSVGAAGPQDGDRRLDHRRHALRPDRGNLDARRAAVHGHGNLGFANAWLAMGSFAVCCGWVVLSTRVVGRWLGWWAIVAGGGLILVRFAWSGEIWFAPYSLFWLWVIIVCIQLIRRKMACPAQNESRFG